MRGGIPTTRYVMPHHRRNCTAAASKRYAHVVEESWSPPARSRSASASTKKPHSGAQSVARSP